MKKEFYFVGGYYKDEEVLKVLEKTGTYTSFENVGLYTLEEALKLPFVKGVEEYYKDKYGEDRDFYMDLTKEEQAKIVTEYVESDELATLRMFTDLDSANKYKENIEDFIKEDKVYYNLYKLIGYEYDYDNIVSCFEDTEEEIIVNEDTNITSNFDGEGLCKLIVAYENTENSVEYRIYINQDNRIVSID